ncbi:MAG: hypothetical protein M5U15_09875 [Kiritimatiellae bacterium]|nr:hypothetical protein [Kiritimatiellia bacterium]
MKKLLQWAIVAIECENSLWCARRMPGCSTPLAPQKRLGGLKSLRKAEEPRLVADSITDKNGHILPYVRFEGGKTVLSKEAISTLCSLGAKKGL